MDLQRHFKSMIANVYFQPDENTKLQYDCIVYQRARIDTMRADDRAHKLDHGYKVILIHRSPDNPLIDQIASMPKCRFQREYVSNGLIHDEFILYWN